MSQVLMPRLSDSMEEATIIAWLKQDGEQVAPGDELVEIETDKATMVCEAEASGFLRRLVEENEAVAVGEPIAELLEAPAGAATDASEDRDDEKARLEAPAAEENGSRADSVSVSERPVAGPPSPPPDSGAASTRSIKASPLARRIARDHGVDLATITPSGPGDRVVIADVRALLAPQAPSPEPSAPARSASVPAPDLSATKARGEVEVVEPTRLQQAVARRMAESKATVPHFYLQAEVDMTLAVESRTRLKALASGRIVPSLNDMILKAAAIALRRHPRVNGAYRDGKFELYSRVNIGVAVAATDALVVPTIYDADQKGLAQIARESRTLAARVKEKTITPPELSGATFTVSNLGMYGMSTIGPIINPPQAAILGVGAISEVASAAVGNAASSQIMRVTLACDHRILYGADAAQFLSEIRTVLEEPLGLGL